MSLFLGFFLIKYSMCKRGAIYKLPRAMRLFDRIRFFNVAYTVFIKFVPPADYFQTLQKRIPAAVDKIRFVARQFVQIN